MSRPSKILLFNIFLSALITANFYFCPLSRGDRYFLLLQKWYFHAASDHWDQAAALESRLDPADINLYRLAYLPQNLKKQLNTLVVKSPKTADDWMAIAQIQSRLNRSRDALDSLKSALLTDPIRPDIEKVYFDLVKD